MESIYLIKYINNFENNKATIISIWINSQSFLEIIQKHKLDINIVKKRYSFAILEYFINVIKKSKKDEVSIFVIDFLQYLKKHQIKAKDLFLIYWSFNSSFIEYCKKEKIYSLEIQKEIDFYYEKIFSKVLDIYTTSIKDIKKVLDKSIDIIDKYVIMSRTDEKGLITSVSFAFCKISGYNSRELIGNSHNIIRHKDMPKEFFMTLWETIKKGNTWQGEIKNMSKTGIPYWVKTIIHPNFDTFGKIIGYDAVFQNITAQKEVEYQQNIIIEQSKSAAMGEMISMIAHQWRQPLQSVSVLVQKLSILKMLDGEISDERLDKVVEQIRLQLDYMSKTIDDFKDFFKPTKKKQKVEISYVVEKATEFMAYLFNLNSIKLNYNNSVKNEVYLYLNEIIQVLINLMKNSCDAMLERKIENRYININTYKENNFLFIEVEDNAGGISPNIIEKIYDPYFSTKNNKNGTGLGLYMAKTIIEKHSFGSIFVKNNENGTKFSIKLPLNRS